MNECNHKWKVIEDYVSTSYFPLYLFKKRERIKIFECKICGEQRQKYFALREDSEVKE